MSVEAITNRLAYSPAEVAQLLGVTRQHVQNLIARNELASFKIGACRRISAGALEELMGAAAPDAA